LVETLGMRRGLQEVGGGPEDVPRRGGGERDAGERQRCKDGQEERVGMPK
jgi:hypothetical protein